MLHRGVDAVYLDLRDCPRAPDLSELAGLSVVGVLSAAATAVPCGLQTTLPRLPDDVVTATEAVLGGGRLLVGAVEVLPTRFVDVAVPRLPRTSVASCARLLEDLVGDRLAAIRAELPAAALTDLAAGSAACVPALVGRGSGLTPVGDDVLCGWLAVTVAVLGPAEPGTGPAAVADAVRRHAPTATTALSATLLGCAARGEVLPEFRRLVLDLLDPTAAALVHRVTARVDALMRVGHTSGAGLLLGATTALHHLASRSLTP